MRRVVGQEQQTGPGPAGLPYYASLDGLRGAALVAMLFYHSTINPVPGGFLSIRRMADDHQPRRIVAGFCVRAIVPVLPVSLTVFVGIKHQGEPAGGSGERS